MDRWEIQDMFSALGPVTIKPMFGEKGLYYKGHIIAVEFRGDILLKADDRTAPAFAAAGASQWAYEGKTDKAVNMSYWSVPAEAFDDPDLMARWVKLAFEAALRSTNAANKKNGGLGPRGPSGVQGQSPWPLFSGKETLLTQSSRKAKPSK